MIDAYTRKGSGKSLKIFLIRMLSNTKKGLSYIFSQPQQPPKNNFPKNSDLLPSNGITLHLCLDGVILDFFFKDAK